MPRSTSHAVTTLALLLLVPTAFAGTADAPEVSDAAGDCSVAYGNEYIDLVSAWIDDETPSDFAVNVALAKWTEPVAEGAGVTVQFSHQGVAWGVVATFGAMGDGWWFGTGRVTSEGDAQAQGFEDAEGSFAAGSPAVLTIRFPKSLFPHVDASDNALRDFWAASVDLRPAYPFFVGEGLGLPTDSNGRWIVCDEAESTATYEFTSGEHSSAHGGQDMGGAGNATGEPTPDEAPASAAPEPVAPAATGDEDTPGLGVVAVLLVTGLAGLTRRRRA